MASSLRGGTYKGVNSKGSECTVTVFDNGGDGTGYSVDVTTPVYNTANLGTANVSVTVGTAIEPRLQITAYGVLGANFESYFSIEDSSGQKTVTVMSRIGNERANANCTIQ